MYEFYQAQLVREIKKYMDKHYREETAEEKQEREKKPYINLFLK